MASAVQGYLARESSSAVFDVYARDLAARRPTDRMSKAEQSDLMKVIGALRSLQDLEVLLILMDDRERWWGARAIAQVTGDSSSSAGKALDRLAGQNLLDIRVTDDVRFRYRPGTLELEQAGSALADAYRRNPLAVIKLVSARRPRSAADFANAFRIRRDDDR